jgi:hypothetical protein
MGELRRLAQPLDGAGLHVSETGMTDDAGLSPMIVTIDNPGWTVEIDVTNSPVQEQLLGTHKKDINEDDCLSVVGMGTVTRTG